LYPGTGPLGIAECESAAQQVAAQTETTSFQASSKDGDVVLKKNDTLLPCVFIGYLTFFFAISLALSAWLRSSPVTDSAVEWGWCPLRAEATDLRGNLKEDNEAFQLSLGRQ